MLIVNLTRTCNPHGVFQQVAAVANAWRPYSEIPRLIHAEGDATEIARIPGVLSVEDDKPNRPLLVRSDPSPQQETIGRRQGKALHYVHETTGAGVDLYVIDTGIDGTVPEFGGRVTRIHDPWPFQALHMHGTAMASIAAGGVNGIAPGAAVFDVRILDWQGNGSVSQAIDGMVATLSHWQASGKARPAVVNMSWGVDAPTNPYAATLDAMIDAGMVLVGAAGNGGDDLDLQPQWPGADPDIISVGASDWLVRRPYSDHGTAVDLFAYGHGRYSVPGGGTGEGHGASVSSAACAGAMARLLDGHHGLTDRASVTRARDTLIAWAARIDPLASDTTTARLYLPAERIFTGLPMVAAAHTY